MSRTSLVNWGTTLAAPLPAVVDTTEDMLWKPTSEEETLAPDEMDWDYTWEMMDLDHPPVEEDVQMEGC